MSAVPSSLQEQSIVVAADESESRSPRRMPLVTIPTAGGDSIRIRCELHTPWTQLIGHPELQNTSTSPSNASANQHPGASSGAAAASPVPAMPLRTTPISGAAGSAPATAEGVPHAGGSSADSQLRQRREPQHSPPRDQPHLQFHGDTMVNDPQRSKLLIVASLGVEGGSGWFSHVAQHFADLRDPATGQPAADVVTFDNRWVLRCMAAAADCMGSCHATCMLSGGVAMPAFSLDTRLNNSMAALYYRQLHR